VLSLCWEHCCWEQKNIVLRTLCSLQKTLNRPWFKAWPLTKFTALTTTDNTSLKFSGRVFIKMSVLRTLCFGVWYPQGARVPPVKNHCSTGSLQRATRTGQSAIPFESVPYARQTLSDRKGSHFRRTFACCSYHLLLGKCDDCFLVVYHKMFRWTCWKKWRPFFLLFLFINKKWSIRCIFVENGLNLGNL